MAPGKIELQREKTWRLEQTKENRCLTLARWCVGKGGSGIKKKGGWQRRIDAFCDVWLSSGSRRQNPTHALSGQSNRGKFLSLGNSWRQKKKAWLRQWSGVSELLGQRDGQQRRAGVLFSLLFRVWRWISFFCYWIGWLPASQPGTLSPAAGGYHATASAMFSTTSSRRNVLTMTIAQIRVVLTSLDTRGYIENHRQRTGEG